MSTMFFFNGERKFVENVPVIKNGRKEDVREGLGPLAYLTFFIWSGKVYLVMEISCENLCLWQPCK